MVKTVSIKDVKEKNLIKFLVENEYIDNFSYYVKNLIKEDMNRRKNVESGQKEIKETRKRKTDFVTE